MITFTDRAKEMVLSYLDQSEGTLEALRITARPGSPVAPSYDLTLVELTDRADDEREVDAGGFAVLLREADQAGLEGATIDFVERVNESGFEVRTAAKGNGARPPRQADVTGPLADRVRGILDTQINPAIASHGGMIALVDVDGTEVYLEMSGGCQGCAMSRMTLRQGVERMLREALPELTAVHDVTDHASGDNPYFQQPV